MKYFTSDTHFFHDKEFIWKKRGFDSLAEMHSAYIEEWKSKVQPEDDVYVLGDFFLGSDYDGIEWVLSQLPGRIHLIIGNHDTDGKIAYYKTKEQIVEVAYATMIVDQKRRFYLSHYVTETSTLWSNTKTAVLGLHGHLHVKERHIENKPYLYNVSVDANDGKLVTLDDVRASFWDAVKENRGDVLNTD